MSDLTSQYIIAQEEHDYNKKYEEGTIVKHTIDDVTTAYTAKKNVPQFISILNENYWKKIASTTNSGGGGVDIFDEDVVATDAQRNKALANVSNQTANSTTGKMGYKVLDTTKTFAEQVTAENTIYEVRDVFDLDKGSVTIPANCTLKFNGGLIKNCNIQFSNTSIISDYTCFDSVVFNGTVADKDCYFELLGIIENDITESNNIKWAFENYRNIYLKANANYKYLCGIYQHIVIKSNTTIIGNNTTFDIGSDYGDVYALFYLYNVDNVIINGVNISCTKGGVTTIASGKVIASSEIQGIHCTGLVNNLTIEKCSFINCRVGIKSSTINSIGKISNVYIVECNFTDSTNGIQGHNWDNLHIDNCTFLTTEDSNSHRLYLYPIDGSNAYINNCIFKQFGAYGAICQFYYDGDVVSKSKIYMSNCYLEGNNGTGIIVSNGVELYIDNSIIKKFSDSLYTDRNAYGSYISVNQCTMLDCGWLYGRIKFENSIWDSSNNNGSSFIMAIDGSSDAEILNSTIITAQAFINVNSASSYSNLPKRIEGCDIKCFYNNKAFLFGGGAPSAEIYQGSLIVKNCKINVIHILRLRDLAHTGNVIFDGCEFINNPTVYSGDNYASIDCKIINSTYNKSILNKKVYNNNFIDYQQPSKGISTQRPTLTSSDAGFQFFDTSLSPSKYICWNGTDWVNLDGTPLS